MTPFLLMLLVAALSAASVPLLVIGGSAIGLWSMEIDWNFALQRDRRPHSISTQGAGNYSSFAPAMAVAASLTITSAAIVTDSQGTFAASTGASPITIQVNA